MKSVSADTAKQRWEREVLAPALKKSPERPVPFTTISGRPIDRLYAPDDLADFDAPPCPQHAPQLSRPHARCEYRQRGRMCLV